MICYLEWVNQVASFVDSHSKGHSRVNSSELKDPLYRAKPRTWSVFVLEELGLGLLVLTIGISEVRICVWGVEGLACHVLADWNLWSRLWTSLQVGLR